MWTKKHKPGNCQPSWPHFSISRLGRNERGVTVTVSAKLFEQERQRLPGSFSRVHCLRCCFFWEYVTTDISHCSRYKHGKPTQSCVYRFLQSFQHKALSISSVPVWIRLCFISEEQCCFHLKAQFCFSVYHRSSEHKFSWPSCILKNTDHLLHGTPHIQD